MTGPGSVDPTTGRTRGGVPGVDTPDLTRREIGSIAPLVLALVLFGFYPMPLLDVSNPTVHTLLQHAGVSDQAPVVPAAEKAQEGQQ
jgi:NADH-quinone oxidoreductase subunit M